MKFRFQKFSSSCCCCFFFHYFKSSKARVNSEFNEQDGRKKRTAKQTTSSPPFFLRDSRASETRACVKITPREKRRLCVTSATLLRNSYNPAPLVQTNQEDCIFRCNNTDDLIQSSNLLRCTILTYSTVVTRSTIN